jgi:DNA-directed RNA polymerases I and III subunit RPAC1
VFAEAITWIPQGEQATLFAQDPPRVVNPKILLTKLRPGQEIHLEMHAIKSNGRDHTKFSPVATASYRLMPHIQLLKPGDRYAVCSLRSGVALDQPADTMKSSEESRS